MRWLLPVACLLCIVSGGYAYAGEWHMTRARIVMPHDPLTAFRMNLQAYKAYPLDAITRMQVMLSLGKVMDLPARIVIYHHAADAAYDTARTALPHHPLIVLLRLEYLLNARRNPAEAGGLVDYLAEHAKKQPEAVAAVKAWRNE